MDANDTVIDDVQRGATRVYNDVKSFVSDPIGSMSSALGDPITLNLRLEHGMASIENSAKATTDNFMEKTLQDPQYGNKLIAHSLDDNIVSPAINGADSLLSGKVSLMDGADALDRSMIGALTFAGAPELKLGEGVLTTAAESTVSETQGAITNLGSRTVQSNAALLDALPSGGGMSGVFDHSTGNFVLRNSSDVYGPLPEGWVRQTGGHASVRSDLGLAIGEDLSGAAPGRLSGFAVVRGADGQIQFRWNSGQINIGSHGSRAVPEPLRPEIESAVNAATGP